MNTYYNKSMISHVFLVCKIVTKNPNIIFKYIVTNSFFNKIKLKKIRNDIVNSRYIAKLKNYCIVHILTHRIQIEYC